MARRYMRDKNEAVYSFYFGIESSMNAQSSRRSSSAVLMMMDEKRDSGWVSLEGFLQPTLAAACGSAFVRVRSGAEAPLMCSQRRTPTPTAAGPPPPVPFTEALLHPSPVLDAATWVGWRGHRLPPTRS